MVVQKIIVYDERKFFWKSNEFKDPKIHRFVSDLSKEQDLNLIAILETVKGFPPPMLKNMWRQRIFVAF